MPRHTLFWLVLCGSFASASLAGEGAAMPPAGPFDSDPHHIANRFHRLFFMRTTPDGRELGYDRVDPLLWRESIHLLRGESYERAAELLHDLNAEPVDHLFSTPLKRAMLQRDLWAIFDWAAERKRPEDQRAQRQLQAALAHSIARVALDSEQIEQLADNYAAAAKSGGFPKAFDPQRPDQAFLPPDLLHENGPWVCIRADQGLPAPAHARALSRSVLSVFINLPGGRAATLAYLKQLVQFTHHWQPTNPMQVAGHDFQLDRATPQLPARTQVALLRRAILIDTAGEPVVSRISESLQIRVYRTVPDQPVWDIERRAAVQATVEFVLTRGRVFAGQAGGLRAIETEERDYQTGFAVHGIDWIDQASRGGQPPGHGQQVIRQTCVTCHGSPGIFSVNSLTRLFGPIEGRPPQLHADSMARIEQLSIDHKRQRYDWGLLEGLMRSR